MGDIVHTGSGEKTVREDREMIVKIIIGFLVLTGLFLYVIVHGSSKKVDDEMQKRLDEEQARIVAEMSKKD